MELPKSLKLAIFDFDGTIFHLDAMDWPTLRRVLGVPDGEPLGDALQRLRTAHDSVLDVVTRAELQAVGDRRLSEATIAVLQQLAKYLQLAILTRNSRQAVEQAMQGTALQNKIHIVGREDAEHLKPHPEGVHYIIDHFAVPAAYTVMIGDTYHDVEAAKAAGVLSVVVHNERLAFQPKDASAYVQSLAELPKLLLNSQ